MSDRAGVIDAYRRHMNRGAAMLAEVTGAHMERSADGAVVLDEGGGEYLACGGYGVFLLGHRHPAVVAAVARQLDRMPLSTRSLLSPELAAAAEALVARTPEGLDRVFFATTGAEAVELSLKLARLAGRRRIVAMEGGYHGKTFGALSVTGRELYRRPFEPLLPGVSFVPFGDARALERVLAEASEEVCVLLEPVQGEGGVCVPPEGYLLEVERACRARGSFLVLDEIQTGLGRLGHWWGCEAAGVVPDVLLSGKALGGGVVPVSAVVATDEAFGALKDDPVLHSSTFAGAPIATAAARATLDAIESEGLIERANALAPRFREVVEGTLATACGELVTEVRGQGLMLGAEFRDASIAAEIVVELQQRRVLVTSSLNAHQVVRFTPPAILEEHHLEWLAESLHGAGEQVARTYGRHSVEA